MESHAARGSGGSGEERNADSVGIDGLDDAGVGAFRRGSGVALHGMASCGVVWSDWVGSLGGERILREDE